MAADTAQEAEAVTAVAVDIFKMRLNPRLKRVRTLNKKIVLRTAKLNKKLRDKRMSRQTEEAPEEVSEEVSEKVPEAESESETVVKAETEQMAAEAESKPGSDAEPEPESKPEPDTEPEPESKSEPESKPEPDAEPEPESKSEPEAESKPGPDAELETESKPEPDTEPESEHAEPFEIKLEEKKSGASKFVSGVRAFSRKLAEVTGKLAEGAGKLRDKCVPRLRSFGHGVVSFARKLRPRELKKTIKNRQFECYLLKNRIWGIAAAVAMTVVVILMAADVSLFDRFGSDEMDSFAAVYEDAGGSDADVVITIARADYTGYDYYEDSERKGRYYYIQENGRFAIALIDSNEDVLINYTMRGRVLTDDALYDDIVESLANDMCVDKGQLESVTYAMIVSELDYPRIYYNLMLMVFIAVILWMVYVIGESIYVITHPWTHPGANIIDGRRSDKSTIRDIDAELAGSRRYEQDGVVITDSYLVCHSLFGTDAVAIDSIESFKKLKTTSNTDNDKPLFKLVLSDVDGQTYEQDFRTERALDEALTYLKREDVSAETDKKD